MSTVEPSYPVYVLIWDEKSFKEIGNPRGLSYFEEPDLHEGPHIAWDQAGREYLVAWDEVTRQPRLTLMNDKGVESFRKAVAEYADKLVTQSAAAPPRHRCDPNHLLELVKHLQNGGSL